MGFLQFMSAVKERLKSLENGLWETRGKKWSSWSPCMTGYYFLSSRVKMKLKVWVAKFKRCTWSACYWLKQPEALCCNMQPSLLYYTCLQDFHFDILLHSQFSLHSSLQVYPYDTIVPLVWFPHRISMIMGFHMQLPEFCSGIFPQNNVHKVW